MRTRISAVRDWLQRLLLWRVWERMLEIEFVDRSIALAGKAFVSFFPLVIVIASFLPKDLRASVITTLTNRLGFRGHALASARQAFTTSDDVREATGVLGLVLTIFFATSFTTAVQRVYFRAWRRPHRGGSGKYWKGISWLLAIIAYMALIGALRDVFGDGLGLVPFAIAAVAASTGLWWFTAWFLLLGDVRARVLLPTGLITGIALSAFAVSATIWMPKVLTSQESQFGIFGVALALVTWFSGAATCILIGACAGPVFAEDTGRVGSLIRGTEDSTLTTGAQGPLPPPTRELTLRDAFEGSDDT
jgi:membrane protein